MSLEFCAIYIRSTCLKESSLDRLVFSSMVCTGKSFSLAMLREEKLSDHEIVQTFPEAVHNKDEYVLALKGHIYFLFGLLKKKIPASFVNDSAEQNSSGGKKTKKKKSKKRRKKTKKRKRKKRRKTRRKKKTRKRRKY